MSSNSMKLFNDKYGSIMYTKNEQFTRLLFQNTGDIANYDHHKLEEITKNTSSSEIYIMYLATTGIGWK